jgi:hypothetical protein
MTGWIRIRLVYHIARWQLRDEVTIDNCGFVQTRGDCEWLLNIYEAYLGHNSILDYEV